MSSFRSGFARFNRLFAPLPFIVMVVVLLIVYMQPASALIRLGKRTLFINNSEPGVTTDYTISFFYTTPANIGSVDMLFCNDPIPHHPCDIPTGLDVSGAVLAEQTGEIGYTANILSSNHIRLERPLSMTGSDYSLYKFTNIVNPSVISPAFSIRLATYESTDGTGPIVNLGSVRTQITHSIEFETQVPPILVFCVEEEVAEDRTSTSGGNYRDLGDLDEEHTLTATSQMAAGTNASGGYTITAYGTSMAAGASEITALSTPTVSAPGNNQFGMNLRDNSDPDIGQDKSGDYFSYITIVSPDYDIPNRFTFRNGDVVAYTPAVSLMKRYTVSYIVNTAPNLRAGYYTTTITYVCTGAF